MNVSHLKKGDMVIAYYRLLGMTEFYVTSVVRVFKHDIKCADGDKYSKAFGACRNRVAHGRYIVPYDEKLINKYKMQNMGIKIRKELIQNINKIIPNLDDNQVLIVDTILKYFTNEITDEKIKSALQDIEGMFKQLENSFTKLGERDE